MFFDVGKPARALLGGLPGRHNGDLAEGLEVGGDLLHKRPDVERAVGRYEAEGVKLRQLRRRLDALQPLHCAGTDRQEDAGAARGGSMQVLSGDAQNFAVAERPDGDGLGFTGEEPDVADDIAGAKPISTVRLCPTGSE